MRAIKEILLHIKEVENDDLIGKTDILIEGNGIGVGRKEMFLQKLKGQKELYKWFNRNFNVIEIVPTLYTMSQPLGVILASGWDKNLLDTKITKEAVGLSLFDFIKENRLNKEASFESKRGEKE